MQKTRVVTCKACYAKTSCATQQIACNMPIHCMGPANETNLGHECA